MPQTLLIVIANADIDQPQKLVTPLFQATVAAAMEYEVEVVFSGSCRALVQTGMAEQQMIPDTDKTIHDLIREAYDSGVVLKLCGAVHEQAVIAEISETVGDAYVIERAMQVETVTFTY